MEGYMLNFLQLFLTVTGLRRLEPERVQLAAEDLPVKDIIFDHDYTLSFKRML